MKTRSIFYAGVTLMWIFLGIFLNKKLFEEDGFSEAVLVVCLASISIMISLAIEFFILSIKAISKNDPK